MLSSRSWTRLARQLILLQLALGPLLVQGRLAASSLSASAAATFAAALAGALGSPVAAAASSAAAWRLVNSEEVEVAWRVRSVQFFEDDDCTRPLEAEPNYTGTPLASASVEFTGAEHAFALRSPRGWESEEACAPGECYLGFRWDSGPVSVRCVLLQQGDDGFYAPGITLQSSADGDAWVDVVSWTPVEKGRAKMAMACPARPPVAHAQVSHCRVTDDRSQQCALSCDEGFGTVEPQQRCIHGAWYSPECLPVGSLLRVVAMAPERIKPYWVVMHATLFESPDCTGLIRMDGVAISSGEYVIKYANYHPSNVWDGDGGTSWASKEPCEPGSCYLGFRFRTLPPRIRCVRIEHPEGRQYRATEVSVEALGSTGWEPLPDDVTVQLLPELRAQEEL